MKAHLLALVGMAVVTSACSRTLKSATLGLEYEAPDGIRFESELPGPPPRATFSDGLTIYAVSVAERARHDDLPPDKRLASILSASGVSVGGKIRRADPGDIPAGTVMRYELQSGQDRTLLYYVPRKTRFLLWVLTAPEDRFDHLQMAVDLSMSSVRLSD